LSSIDTPMRLGSLSAMTDFLGPFSSAHPRIDRQMESRLSRRKRHRRLGVRSALANRRRPGDQPAKGDMR
jgi:hypothetical protein